jgi:hypothetical protein
MLPRPVNIHGRAARSTTEVSVPLFTAHTGVVDRVYSSRALAPPHDMCRLSRCHDFVAHA